MTAFGDALDVLSSSDGGIAALLGGLGNLIGRGPGWRGRVNGYRSSGKGLVSARALTAIVRANAAKALLHFQ